ncbi:MAG: MarR family transcriptional regulator [Bacteroidota bacterium]|nr:MarR family transcriptional regulator [Bacteroidota bacterium]
MKIEDEIKQVRFKDSHQKAVINILYTSNWLMENQAKLLKPFGITPQQFNVLRILRGQSPNPATIKLIKERMLDKMSDASRIVEKLRIKGLVERDICPTNRRNVDVKITEKGLKLLSDLDEYNPELHKLMNNLNSQEIDHLNSILDKLRG